MEQGNDKQSEWMVCLETLELIYMSPLQARQKTTLPLALKLWYNPLGEIGHVALLFIARPRHHRRPHPPDASPAIPPRVRRHRSFSVRPDPVSARRASGLGFVAQPSNQRFSGEPPQTPRANSGCEPLPCTGSDRWLRLAFLATKRSALDPVGHRVPRVRPTCLSTPRRPRKA
jgi:hypothetical protein